MADDDSTAAGEAAAPFDESGIPPDHSAAQAGESEEAMHFVEVWNDYDPSQRFVVIFPVGEEHGASASSVAYYIIEPGKHSGVHADNAEEIVFVAEGEGEVFSIGNIQPLEAGKFVVFPAGAEHDIYAKGAVALRLLSFFPTTEIISTFQQIVYPIGTTVLSSKPPRPLVTELDPDNLPDDFPFDLAELGLAPAGEQELTMTQRLIGMTPGQPPQASGEDVPEQEAREGDQGEPASQD